MSLTEVYSNTLGLYVQVPFCASKCTFCNFTSGVAPASHFDDYCTALVNEIEGLSKNYQPEGIAPPFGLNIDTVYFGGGTPTLLGAQRLRKVILALRERFCFAAPLEFTMEATPGSIDEVLCEAALEMAINRLSTGAQSFNDRELSSTGRLHTSEDTRAMVKLARRIGFQNINLDLIAGMPYQTMPTWLASIDDALRLRPEHVSIYLFEIDEKSRLGSEVLRHGSRLHADAVPNDDFMADAYEAGRERLIREGFVQYEISNFALPGNESRHNQKYWQLQPYVGLGAGAHSFDGGRRWSNEIAVDAYQDKISRGASPIAEIRTLSSREQMEEFFFLGLRQKAGISLQTAREHWGRHLVGRWEPKLASLESQGWITRDEDQVSLPASAYLVSNEIFQEFILK